MTTPREQRDANLRALRELFAQREAWTRGAYARDADGNELFSHQINNVDVAKFQGQHRKEGAPVCFCLRGGLVKVLNMPSDVDPNDTPEHQALKAATRDLYRVGQMEMNLIDLNDVAIESHAELLWIIDRAMEVPLA